MLKMKKLWTFGLKDSWCIYNLWIFSFRGEEGLEYNLLYDILSYIIPPK